MLLLLWSCSSSSVSSSTSRQGYPETSTTCLVDDVFDLSSLDWLFGLSPGCRPGNASSADCGLPSVAGMLHTAGNYTWQGCQTVRGNALFHDLPLLAAPPL